MSDNDTSSRLYSSQWSFDSEDESGAFRLLEARWSEKIQPLFGKIFCSDEASHLDWKTYVIEAFRISDVDGIYEHHFARIMHNAAWEVLQPMCLEMENVATEAFLDEYLSVKKRVGDSMDATVTPFNYLRYVFYHWRDHHTPQTTDMGHGIKRLWKNKFLVPFKDKLLDSLLKKLAVSSVLDTDPASVAQFILTTACFENGESLMDRKSIRVLFETIIERLVKLDSESFEDLHKWIRFVKKVFVLLRCQTLTEQDVTAMLRCKLDDVLTRMLPQIQPFSPEALKQDGMLDAAGVLVQNREFYEVPELFNSLAKSTLAVQIMEKSLFLQAPIDVLDNVGKAVKEFIESFRASGLRDINVSELGVKAIKLVFEDQAFLKAHYPACVPSVNGGNLEAVVCRVYSELFGGLKACDRNRYFKSLVAVLEYYDWKSDMFFLPSAQVTNLIADLDEKLVMEFSRRSADLKKSIELMRPVVERTLQDILDGRSITSEQYVQFIRICHQCRFDHGSADGFKLLSETFESVLEKYTREESLPALRRKLSCSELTLDLWHSSYLQYKRRAGLMFETIRPFAVSEKTRMEPRSGLFPITFIWEDYVLEKLFKEMLEQLREQLKQPEEHEGRNHVPVLRDMLQTQPSLAGEYGRVIGQHYGATAKLKLAAIFGNRSLSDIDTLVKIIDTNQGVERELIAKFGYSVLPEYRRSCHSAALVRQLRSILKSNSVDLTQNKDVLHHVLSAAAPALLSPYIHLYSKRLIAKACQQIKTMCAVPKEMKTETASQIMNIVLGLVSDFLRPCCRLARFSKKRRKYYTRKLVKFRINNEYVVAEALRQYLCARLRDDANQISPDDDIIRHIKLLCSCWSLSTCQPLLDDLAFRLAKKRVASGNLVVLRVLKDLKHLAKMTVPLFSAIYTQNHLESINERIKDFFMNQEIAVDLNAMALATLASKPIRELRTEELPEICQKLLHDTESCLIASLQTVSPNISHIVSDGSITVQLDNANGSYEVTMSFVQFVFVELISEQVAVTLSNVVSHFSGSLQEEELLRLIEPLLVKEETHLPFCRKNQSKGQTVFDLNKDFALLDKSGNVSVSGSLSFIDANTCELTLVCSSEGR